MNNGGNSDVISQFLSHACLWHGFEPLRHLTGYQEIWSRFWQPLFSAMPDLLRRPYHFIGGHFAGGNWVCGTGDFIGSFVKDWHLEQTTIPANGQTVHFRFGEFCRIEEDKIVEIRILVDLIDLLRHVGIQLVLGDYGRSLWIPGPSTGDGVLLDTQDPAESAKTLDLVEMMIFGGLNKYDGMNQDSQGLELYWHQNMVWHGPAGIGSSFGMGEFKKNAQGPIVNAFPDRKGVGHVARIAEGRYAASTGWPSLAGTHLNDYLDWPATGDRIGWNIMDFWRRDGEKLIENWVMIDLIDAAKASKVDLLGRL